MEGFLRYRAGMINIGSLLGVASSVHNAKTALREFHLLFDWRPSMQHGASIKQYRSRLHFSVSNFIGLWLAFFFHKCEPGTI